MKTLLLISAIVFSGCLSLASDIAPTTGDSSSKRFELVDALRAGDNGTELSLIIQEANAKGPACDLVIKSMDYDSDAKSLTLIIQPATFCPVDAIAQRKAFLIWNLPNELRGSGATLDVITNGQKLITLNLYPTK